MEYKLPLPEFIPNHQLSYSDHEAVLAKIQITDTNTLITKTEQTCGKIADNYVDDCRKILQECINVCDDSLNLLRSHKRCYYLMALTAFVILVYALDIYPPYGWRTMYTILKVLLSGLVLFFVFMATLWNAIEYNGIYSGKLEMEMALQGCAYDLLDGNECEKSS